ncbi:MAG: GDSL-type esterase/lipase family protein [Verrucomicrobiae bacterium]|nr:GDSL-type esterase/lipase family protein [Verrucomicrobiae bacterium]
MAKGGDAKAHSRLIRQKDPVVLSLDWQEVAFEFQVMDPLVKQLAVMAEICGEGAEASLDDASLATATSPDVSWTPPPEHAMATMGEKATFRVSVFKGGQPAAGMVIKTLTCLEYGGPCPKLPADWTDIRTDSLGIAEFSFEPSAQAAASAIYRIVVAQPDSGLACTTYLEFANKAACEAFATAAEKAKLSPQPAYLLFIGDSLTDFQRGYNYVDELRSWLQAAGKQAATHNAGVSGDFVTRVWQRMNKDPKVHRLEMYDNLFDPKPTHIFFFLGHNDSRVSYISNDTQPHVSFETFEDLYRQIIQKAQKETGARVTVISSTSSQFEVCKANTGRARAAGKKVPLYGKPDVLEKFNAMAKKVAKETGADFVDMYEPFRVHPNKPNLLDPNDGVHLTNEGNRLVALELLRYLGR